MYKDIETETSYRYLSRVISKLHEPVCILGGWAVFLTVNSNFKKQTGRVYIGSRDIDVGFNSISSFKGAALTLEKELGFERVSFRYYKGIHAETGKELTDENARKLPVHSIFPMYVDLILSFTSENVKSEIGFAPVDEPLLKEVFENNKYGLTEEFGRKIMLPEPEILLATKINSVLARGKTHKRIKDVCDIAALCLFSGMPIDSIIGESKRFVSTDVLKSFSNADFADAITEGSRILGLEPNVISSTINKIKNK